tara:strand:- start:1694 stop:3121 length:1428 start_codon:yes stop_codon:yes gene_type:complete
MYQLENLWLPYIKPEKEVERIMPKKLQDEIKALYKEYKRNPDQFIYEISENQDLKVSSDLYHLSLPRRKRLLGNKPLGLEVGLFNTPSSIQYRIIERLALTDSALGNISHDLTMLPDVQNFLQTMHKHAPLSGTNLGVYAHSFFHNRFEMVDAPIFSLEDSLYRELCDTDIGGKTPCEFFRPPMPNLYLEFGQTRDPELPLCWHEQSGWHCMEGAYLNTFTLTEEELRRECDNPKLQLGNVSLEHNRYNVISHALADGFIHKDGGDVQVTEILVTGSPLGKNHILDDSTHQFVIVVQDREMDVEAMLDWHLRFNRKELASQQSHRNSGHTDHLPLRHVYQISDNEATTISSTVHAITKALLYINSTNSATKNVYDATEQQKAIARTKNKAKIRKLEKAAKTLSDYILISLPSDDKDIVESYEKGNTGSKSTHWRKGHFHPYRYGEGRKKLRVKWIPRTLINPTKGLAKQKDYKVK